MEDKTQLFCTLGVSIPPIETFQHLSASNCVSQPQWKIMKTVLVVTNLALVKFLLLD